MRAKFHGQNIFALGNGFAKLQTPPLVIDTPENLKNPDPDPEPSTPQPEPKPQQ